MDFCKAKINVFRGATAFAKATYSAKLLLSVCYKLVAALSCGWLTCLHTQKQIIRVKTRQTVKQN